MSNKVRFRFARADEIHDVARMTAHSFPGPTRTVAWWEEQLRDPVFGGGSETLVVGDASGRLVAACQIHPLREWIAGVALQTAGVGSVAVSPTHRKRGRAVELMAAALRAARERGDVASALYPFRISFYKKLGYGQAGMALQYQIVPGALPDATERLRVELLESESERVEALELYERWIRGQTGQLERGSRLWTQLCTSHDRALAGYRGDGGQLEGYALVMYRTDLPPRDRYLEVDELVWTSAQARRGLYAWLASLGDQWHQLLLRALPSHRMGDWISAPRLPHGAAPSWRLWDAAATLLLGPMFRLLDLTAWERRRINPGPPLRVALEVADGEIQENQDRWLLAFDGERVTFERGVTTDLTLRLGISTLSRLFIGSISAADALEAGLLECDRPDRLGPLDAALALPEAWTFDRF